MWLIPSRGLDSLSGKNKSPGSVSLPLEGVILSLQDLIFYFRPPEEELEHEEKQTKLRSLRNRQNLFQEEVSRSLPTRLPNKNSKFNHQYWNNDGNFNVFELLVQLCLTVSIFLAEIEGKLLAIVYIYIK